MTDNNTELSSEESKKDALRAEREQRVDTAMALGKPDRVPFVPKMSGYYMLGYDISFYDAMMDARNMEQGFRSFMRDFEPDAVNIGGLYGIPALRALGTEYLRWPGPDHNLPLESSFQHLDGQYLHDDELKEFAQDPTHVTLTKLLPRKHRALAGLSKLYLRETTDLAFINGLAAFADPEVRSALFALMDAGKATAERLQQMAEVQRWVAEEGYSTYCQGTFFIPFDSYADSIRGILQITLDLIDYPEETRQIVQKLTELNVERIVKLFKSRGAKRIFIPLHCGVDEFMSPANYERFYWPCLKTCIMTVIDNGMTPVVFCEGNYNTRLETICDVPPGKVVYAFEKVDLKRAKETVGKVACICGTMPNTLLIQGTPEQVIAETRRQIDILAPGGGFIMDCSIMLDNAKAENMHAWREATLEYGKY